MLERENSIIVRRGELKEEIERNLADRGEMSAVYAKTFRNGTLNLAAIQSITEDGKEKGYNPMWVLTIVNEEIPLSPDDGELIKAMNGGTFGAYIELTRPYINNPETG